MSETTCTHKWDWRRYGPCTMCSPAPIIATDCTAARKPPVDIGEIIEQVRALKSEHAITSRQYQKNLKIRDCNFSSEGIQVKTSKTGKKGFIPWDDELKDVIRGLLRLNKIQGETVICGPRGKPLSQNTFTALSALRLTRPDTQGSKWIG